MQAVVKRSPISLAFLCLFLTMPFTSNNPFYYLVYGSFFLVAFPFVAWLTTRKETIKSAPWLWRQHKKLASVLLLFGVSAFISWFLVLIDANSFFQKALATQRYLTCWILLVYCFMLARFCRKNSDLNALNIFSSLIPGSLILIALLYATYLFTDSATYLNWSIDPPFGSHVRMMGMVASMAAVACVVRIMMLPLSTHALVATYIALLLISGFMVWTGSRTSIVATFLVSILVALCARHYLAVSIKRIAVVFILLAASIPLSAPFAVFEWSGLSRTIAVSTESSLSKTDQAFAEQFTSGRMGMWKVAINGIIEKPAFGQGPHGYFFLEDRPSSYYHTHNLIIEFVLEWGVVGALLLLAALFMLAWQGVKHIAKAFLAKDAAWIMAASMVLLLSLNALTDGIYFLLFPSFFIATAFAFFPFAPIKAQEVKP